MSDESGFRSSVTVVSGGYGPPSWPTGTEDLRVSLNVHDAGSGVARWGYFRRSSHVVINFDASCLLSWE